MSTANGKEGKLKGNLPVERTRPDLSISREPERGTALHTQHIKILINKTCRDKLATKGYRTHDLEVQRLQRAILRRSDRIKARRSILLRPGGLDISLERVGCDVEEGGTGIYNACCVGENGGSTVGDRLVDAPVLRSGGGASQGAGKRNECQGCEI